jgi:hypothetical protein
MLRERFGNKLPQLAPAEVGSMLSNMQGIHDRVPAAEWETNLRQLATNLNLEFPCVPTA